MIGTVIHGTHRNEDLIPAIINKLSDLIEEATFEEGADEHVAEVDDMQDTLGDIERRMQEEDYFESEDAVYDLDELFNLMQIVAPPYCYFGAHEGNGSDFGFWPDYDTLHNEVTNIVDPVELDTIEDDEAVFINDHGNLTFYLRKDGEWQTVWEAV